MKPLAELDHYEVLEIGREASAEEIERAYHVARSAYAEGSLATYSVFGERDTEALRHRIEAAFRALSDPESRRLYDLDLDGDVPHGIADLDPADDPLLESLTRKLVDEEEPRPANPAVGGRAKLPGDLVRAVDFVPLEPGGDCDGAKLRRARLNRGLEIDDVASITKIGPMYLRCIEDDAIEQLPAAVYVRGFVKAFARCVGLDPVEASTSYMLRFEAAPTKKRGRILGRQPQP